VATLLLLEERPRQADVDRSLSESPPPAPRGSMRGNLWLTLNNPALWLLGISLGLLNASRYGYIDWGIKHLSETHPDVGIGLNGLKYAVLPAGGILGSYLAGWATDRFFGSRRAPVAFLLLTLLGALGLVYHRVAEVSVPATVVLLGFIGFCLFGPQVLLVGTAPSDLARKGTSAAAVGFVNALGYFGAAVGDLVTGWARDHYDWQTVTYIWAGWAFGAALASGVLWNVAATRDD
jgi:OPA family glycerol-3-phosphate transporter-like MFS transporter